MNTKMGFLYVSAWTPVPETIGCPDTVAAVREKLPMIAFSQNGVGYCIMHPNGTGIEHNIEGVID